jgi:uncharacterized protein
MPSRSVIEDFLTQRHIAVVGVSHDSRAFANSVYRTFRDRGYVVYPVNPNAESVEGDRCYPTVRVTPDPLDAVLVMVNPRAALGVVDDCIARGVTRVWLHRGAGEGAVSEGAVVTCRAHGIDVVDGACPLMFLEPVGWFHRLHRLTFHRHLAA